MSEVQRMVDEKRAGARAVDFAERKDRVLIVEDEENARKGYEQLLQRWGYEVLSVGNAEDALAKFGSYQPDTLIADVELPGMNGLDLLSQPGPGAGQSAGCASAGGAAEAVTRDGPAGRSGGRFEADAGRDANCRDGSAE